MVEHIHLIGIGGAGMSAIARVLHQQGIRVSGSDRQLSPLAASLQADGVQVFVGHAAENIQGATLVVRSSAVQDDNVEVAAARSQGIPVLKREAFLSQVLADKVQIAVAGSHGKTTTTSMIAWALADSGQAPSFIVGGTVANLSANAQAGAGPYFVIEADEYDRMFLGLRPAIAVVTNVEHDHPDCYPTPEHFTQAFEAFVGCIQPDGMLVACVDDPGARGLLSVAASRGLRALTYGFDEHATYRAENLRSQPGAGYAFDVFVEGEFCEEVALGVPGRHNVLNALAAFAVCERIGLPEAETALALEKFVGAGRRFEVIGEAAGITVIDDYAHHPTEIAATLSAARQRYPGRAVWAVWQPHTFSRTLTLWETFLTCFRHADHLLVTPVYAAREIAPKGFDMAQLVLNLEGPDVRYLPDLEKIASTLVEELEEGAVLLTLSAGDADRVSRQVLDALKKRPVMMGASHGR